MSSSLAALRSKHKGYQSGNPDDPSTVPGAAGETELNPDMPAFWKRVGDEDYGYGFPTPPLSDAELLDFVVQFYANKYGVPVDAFAFPDPGGVAAHTDQVQANYKETGPAGSPPLPGDTQPTPDVAAFWEAVGNGSGYGVPSTSPSDAELREIVLQFYADRYGVPVDTFAFPDPVGIPAHTDRVQGIGSAGSPPPPEVSLPPHPPVQDFGAADDFTNGSYGPTGRKEVPPEGDLYPDIADLKHPLAASNPDTLSAYLAVWDWPFA